MMINTIVMLNKLQHTIALAAGKTVLNSSSDGRLDTGKRLISILAGAFIFSRGMKNLTKSPLIALQELALGGVLLYNGATGENHFNFKAREQVYKGPAKDFFIDPMPQLYRIK